ncbi:MAG: carbohydrate binding domain-containing protein [bacterium]
MTSPAPLRSSEAKGSTFRTSTNWGKYFVVAGELALLLLVIHQFRIEANRGFLELSKLIFAGFMVHALLPLRYRLSFFLLLSIGGIFYLLGLANGAWLIGISLGVIALCHLPVPYLVRVGLVVCAGVALIAMREGWVPIPAPRVILPIICSIFMFRLLIYLFELRHENRPVAWTQRLSYFFLLPNVCFPFFPIVDYKTFQDTYFKGDVYAIYQTGIQWICRGVIHLLVYRFVYYYWTLPEVEVQDVGRLFQFLISNYLLVLRVSGQFHLIIGILYLFGFKLPEVMNRFFLASGPADLWRRINIPWRNFITEFFYNPFFMKLQARGFTVALLGASLYSFVLTWFFHAYQFFWLRGDFPIIPQDIIYWSCFGVFVTINTFYQTRRGRNAALKNKSLTVRQALSLSLRTSGMFLLMAVLWSLWTSPSFTDWLALWDLPSATRWQGAGWVAGLFLIVNLIGIFILVARGRNWLPRIEIASLSFAKSAVLTCATALGVYLLGQFPAMDATASKTAQMIVKLQDMRLNRVDETRLIQGYYEDLFAVHHFNNPIVEMQLTKPADWGTGHGLKKSYTDELLLFELTPLVTKHYVGATMQINRWGMRDRDYEREKSPGTYRIALLGPSDAMGSGVTNDETFEALLEERLNRERADQQDVQFQVLNFAVAGYSPFQQLVMLEKKALAFAPEAVICVAHVSGDMGMFSGYLSKVIAAGYDLRYDFLRNLIAKTGINQGMSEAQIKKRLRPHKDEILSWVYNEIAAQCRKHNVVPIWMLMPNLGELYSRAEVDHLIQQAQAAGFLPISMINVYRNHPTKSLQIAPWDKHPNAEAHRLIAERLYQKLAHLRLADSPGITHQSEIAAIEEEDRGSYWNLQLENGADAHLLFPSDHDENVRLAVNNVASKYAWEIRLSRLDVAVKAGQRYAVQFQARADKPRRIFAGCAQAHEPGDNLGWYREFELVTAWQSFSADFVATADDDNSCIYFDAGANEVPIEIASVRLHAIPIDQAP